jgi:hypothetical protein
VSRMADAISSITCEKWKHINSHNILSLCPWFYNYDVCVRVFVYCVVFKLWGCERAYKIKQDETGSVSGASQTRVTCRNSKHQLKQTLRSFVLHVTLLTCDPLSART